MTRRAATPVACCPGPCARREPLPGGGWACRTLMAAGRLADPGPAVSIDRSADRIAARQPGWSRGAQIPCPRCGCRAYAPGLGGLPQRRCWACNQEFDPEASQAA